MVVTSSPRSPISHESDTDTETPLQTHLTKALSLTNGSLKPHHHLYRPRLPPPPPQQLPQQQQLVASYKECLKNHAATLGGLALDGCGEFMPRSGSTHLDPASSLTCDACGCHRNFHRRVDSGTAFNDLALPPPVHWTSSPSPDSTSPGPVSPHPQSFYSSGAPHVLLALSTAPPGSLDQNRSQHLVISPGAANPLGRKRARTKFTSEQKQKMYGFAEKLGWKLLRGGTNEKAVAEFCSEVGVKRGVFKVWMHNNRHRKTKSDHLHGNRDFVKNEVVGDEGTVGSDSNLNFAKYQTESEVHVNAGSTDHDVSSPSR